MMKQLEESRQEKEEMEQKKCPIIKPLIKRQQGMQPCRKYVSEQYKLINKLLPG